jgi:hypothetical protein
MGAARVKPEGDHLLVSSDIMQHTRNHLIEDLNPMEGSVTKYPESYPRYHERYPSPAALNATYAPKEVINASP